MQLDVVEEKLYCLNKDEQNEEVNKMERSKGCMECNLKDSGIYGLQQAAEKQEELTE